MTDIVTTPQQVQLVKQSFAKTTPIAEQAADLFYGRLFETAPQLRPLFKGDIKTQGRKLMSTIALAVGSLQKLPELVPIVQDLGRRYVGYGVKDDQLRYRRRRAAVDARQGARGRLHTRCEGRVDLGLYDPRRYDEERRSAARVFTRPAPRPCVDRQNKPLRPRRGPLVFPKIRQPADMRCWNNDRR